jgi:hypothetical protein
MTEPPRPFQFTLRGLLGLVGLVALAAGLFQYWYWHNVGRQRDIEQRRQDTLAAERLGLMMTRYLDAQACRWPKSWDDLEAFDRPDVHTTDNDLPAFEEIRDFWEIDFDADPVELAAAEVVLDAPPFAVLRQRHELGLDRPGAEPNLKVFWRLRMHSAVQTALMVIEYMKANGDAWPNNWEDLERYYAAAVNQQGNHHCSFAQAKACMEVDFDADPAQLVWQRTEDDLPTFSVIRPRSVYPTPPTKPTRNPWDPNQRVLAYLFAKQQTDDGQPDVLGESDTNGNPDENDRSTGGPGS